jgi:hypothetical protein
MRTERRGEQIRIRDWTLNLYYVERCPRDQADRSGWVAYAEHASGVAVPPNPSAYRRYTDARADYDRLMEIVR